MSKIIRLYDRSRVTTDWQCPRRRYWQYEYAGKGVVTGTTALELHMGTVLHDGLAAIAGGASVDDIAPLAYQQLYTALATEDDYDTINFANEQATLVEGLLRGFARHVWPALCERYPTIIAIEQEMTYEHDGLVFMSKPDLILADSSEEWVYIEYKSTSTKKTEWINSWNTAVQLHSTVKAVEATLGKAPSSVIVQGFYKGFESYGKQNSPFCYAYSRKGQPPFSKDEVRYDYAAGFRRTPTWEMEGGVKAWVEKMPDTLLADQFPQTPPIFLDEKLIEKFFEQRALREKEIAAATEASLDASFPQKFDACSPGWGRGCPYKQLCFSHVSHPLEAGFTWRTPHHQLELDQQAAHTTAPSVEPSTLTP